MKASSKIIFSKNAHALKRALSSTMFISAVLILNVSTAPIAVQAAELEQSSSLAASAMAIKNFGQVSSSIWRGASPKDQDLEQLAKRGVKTIIDLRYSGEGCRHEEELAATLGIKYIHMPIGFGKISLNEMLDFLKIVSNPKNLPVYVHCRQGADRTGSLIATYRILIQNWTFKKTYQEMRAYHFKPWLFSMKNSIAGFKNDRSTEQALRIALNEEQRVNSLTQSTITSLGD